MNKVIRDGKVAVLYSPGFGAGWSTWNDSYKMELIFNPKIVEMVESGNRRSISEQWIEKNLGLKNVYCGGAGQLQIEWIPEGTKFFISEDDGSEDILFIDIMSIEA